MTAAAQTLVRLGRVVGLFGVKGWVKVFSFTEPREAILEYDRWQLGEGDDWHPVDLESGQKHGKAVIARFRGIEDRDTASAFLGREIAVARQDMPEPGADEYYWTDIEGCSVWHKDERDLGVLDRMLETGAHDVMVVSGDVERLIPFVPGETVLEVDLDARRIRVDWEWD